MNLNQLIDKQVQSPIEGALDELSCQLDKLEAAVSKTMTKTELIRNPFPSSPSPEADHSPDGSTMTMRITNMAKRLRELRESLEQCVAEIEL